VAATGSLHATVTGRPLDRIVIPQDRPPPTSRAARTAISCRNCSTLSVLISASCSSFSSSGRCPPASLTIRTPIVDHSGYQLPARLSVTYAAISYLRGYQLPAAGKLNGDANFGDTRLSESTERSREAEHTCLRTMFKIQSMTGG